MTVRQEPTITLDGHKRRMPWLIDCTCTYAWKSLGRFEQVQMGYGWVRMTNSRTCPEHGEAQP